MTKLSYDERNATLVMSHDEIGILNNALNEVCHALDDAEFSARMGADLAEVQQLLRQLHALGIEMQEKAGVTQPPLGR
jgi:hypothetical protein